MANVANSKALANPEVSKARLVGATTKLILVEEQKSFYPYRLRASRPSRKTVRASRSEITGVMDSKKAAGTSRPQQSGLFQPIGESRKQGFLDLSHRDYNLAYIVPQLRRFQNNRLSVNLFRTLASWNILRRRRGAVGPPPLSGNVMPSERDSLGQPPRRKIESSYQRLNGCFTRLTLR
jgi:hypothetical protein